MKRLDDILKLLVAHLLRIVLASDHIFEISYFFKVNFKEKYIYLQGNVFNQLQGGH